MEEQPRASAQQQAQFLLSGQTGLFVARIILESVHPDEPSHGPDDKLFEDRIILIHAQSEDEARQKAKHFGKAAEHEYRNMYGNRVQWTFRGVLDILDVLDDVSQDGSEVYYAFIDEEMLTKLQEKFELDQ